MMSLKRVSALSVYKQRRLQDEEGEEGQASLASIGTSAGGNGSNGDCGESGAVREGRGEVGRLRKRKRRSRTKLLAKKRRTVDESQEMESTETMDGSGEAVITRTSVGRKKRERRGKMAKRLKNIQTYGSTVPDKKKKKTVQKREPAESGSNEGEEDEVLSEASRLAPASPQEVEVLSVDGGDMVVSFSSQFDPDCPQDSREEGRELFRLLINPFLVDTFFEEIWEKKPIFISRHKPRYNEGWFSTEELDRILKENSLEFSVNVDITSYEDGERHTHNPEGRAVPQVVWDFFQEGCSVRLLNPQTYSSSMWLLTASLQELFQSFVGANIYLTPAGTQGFAPHSDDIEAFVMQLEGRKHWKLYHPRESSEVLPRFSSPNLSQEELGEPILDVILEPGDLLYFPRGIFHQAESLPDVHSLHVTLSTYQKYTWGDVIAKLMSVAVEKAMREDVSFRRGLPLGCLNYTGSHTPNRDDPRRREFVEKLGEYIERLVQEHTLGSVDEVMDQVATENVHSSLPPCLSEGEKACTVEERGSVWRDGRIVSSVKFTTDTEVKLVRYNAVRLVIDSDGHMLYYSQQNSKVFQEKAPQAIPLTSDDVRVVERLIGSYPDYVEIGDLCGYGETLGTELVELLYTLFSHSIILIH